MLREIQQGRKFTDVCRDRGISQDTHDRRRKTRRCLHEDPRRRIARVERGPTSVGTQPAVGASADQSTQDDEADRAEQGDRLWLEEGAGL